MTGSLVVVDVRGGDSPSAAGIGRVGAGRHPRRRARERQRGHGRGVQALAGPRRPRRVCRRPRPSRASRTPSTCTRTAGSSASTSAASGSPPTRPLVEEYGTRRPGGATRTSAGTLTLLTHDEAVFRDDAGHEVRLHADEAGPPGALRLTRGAGPRRRGLRRRPSSENEVNGVARHDPLRPAPGPLPGADDLPAEDDGRPEHAVVARHDPLGELRGEDRRPVAVAQHELVEAGQQEDAFGLLAAGRQPVGRRRVHQVLDPVDVERVELRAGDRQPGAGVAQRQPRPAREVVHRRRAVPEEEAQRELAERLVAGEPARLPAPSRRPARTAARPRRPSGPGTRCRCGPGSRAGGSRAARRWPRRRRRSR